jgi:hypothetical protein
LATGGEFPVNPMPLLVINERLSGDLVLLSKLPGKEYVAEFCRQALEALGAGQKKAALKQAGAQLGLDLETVSSSIMALSLLFVEAVKVRRAGLNSKKNEELKALTKPHTFSQLLQNYYASSMVQRNLSAVDLSLSMSDVAIPEDSKREVSDFYGVHFGELKEGLGYGGGTAGAGAEGGEGGAAAAGGGGAPGGLSALGLALARQELRGGAGALLPASGASATVPEYRGLDWRLEVEVSRRHLHETLEPSFTMQLGVAGMGPEAAGTPSSSSLAASGPHALIFTSDFQSLKAAAASLATAGLERSKAHVKRAFKI